MEDVLRQIQAAARAGLVYPALMAALTIPDICAALGSDGTTSGKKYRAWVVDNLDDWWGGPQAADLYGFRCALLHEGTTRQLGSPDRPVFLFANSPQIMIHKGTHASRDESGNVRVEARVLDIHMFCDEMAAAARIWIAEQSGTQPFDANYARAIRLYPDGYPPHIVGGPVIG